MSSFLVNPYGVGGSGGGVEVVAAGDLAQWLAAFKETGFVNNDPMATLTDHSGNARHMTSSGSNRPLYQTGVLGGQPGFQFDGSARYASCTAFMSGEAELMAVLKVPDASSTSNYGAYKFDGQTNACHFPFFLTTVYTALGINARHSYTFSNNNIPVNGMLHQIQVRTGTNNYKVFENGNNVKITQTPTISWSGGGSPVHLLGASSSNANGSSPGPFFRGHFLEWILWNRYLTDAERNSQLAIFTTRYGLSLTNF